MQITKRTSRNKRKTDHGNVDSANIIQAIKAVMLEKKSARAAGRTYNVPTSSLVRYINAVKAEYKNIVEVPDDKLEAALKRHGTYAACAVNQVFSTEEEDTLVSYIKQCIDHYFELSINELRQLAYQFAIKLRIKYPATWDKNQTTGRDWYYGFLRRHQHLNRNRAKPLSQENIRKFFEDLSAVLTANNFNDLNIWNMNETGFSTAPDKVGKVIPLRGPRREKQIVAAEMGSVVTIALAVNAAGISMPPFFIFPSHNMQETFMDNSSQGAIGCANDSGWMQYREFVKFIKFFIHSTNATKETPTLLLLGNHESQLSIEALDMAAEHGITLFSFPPHCCHRLQPLDVSVYGPLKTHYKSLCTAWQLRNSGKVMDIQHITGLVCTTLDYALTPHNIKEGFEVTGIAPYNPQLFTDSSFIQAIISGENECTEDAEERYEDLQFCNLDSRVSDINVQEEVITSIEPSTSLDAMLSQQHSKLKCQISTESTAKTSNQIVSKASSKRKATSTNTLTNKPAKRVRSQKEEAKVSSFKEEKDFCIICFEQIPRCLDCDNSIDCIECNRSVHLKCFKMTNFFTCQNCNSE